MKSLSDPEIRTRWYATHALGSLGAKASPAIGKLRAILADKQEYEYVRGGAAWALGRIGPAAEPAVPLLIETLSSNHLAVRRAAPIALAGIGGKAREAVPKLVERLKDPDVVVRANSAVALWKLDKHADAVPTLEAMLRGTGPGAYQSAVALEELSPQVPKAGTLMLEGLRHADEDAARASARGLARFGDKAVGPLRRVLQSGDALPGERAVESLARIGPQAVDVLIEALKHKSPTVRRAAARALGQLGPDAKTSSAALLEAASDPDPAVRETAADALKRVSASP